MTGRRLLGLYVLAFAAVASPLLLASVPPLVDYPQHLTRSWILTHADSIPALAANYTVNWRILPDLAMDAVVTALSWAMPVEVAGRVFVALALALLVGGTAALHRALHGRVGLWPLASLFCLYSMVLFWGFVSCLFTTGAALCVFALWLSSRTWPLWARVLAFAPLATLLFLGHLFAFGLYGFLVASHQGGLWLSRRPVRAGALVRAALPGLQFAPGLALWWVSRDTGGTTLTSYGNPLTKVLALLAPFDFNDTVGPLDLLTWCFAAAVVVLCLKRRALALAPEMRLPLAGLAVAAAVMPNWLNGALSADLRIPVVLPLLVIASTAPRARGAGLLRGAAVLAVLLLGVRVWAVGQSFAAYDTWFAEFRAASAAIPQGARLLVVAPPRGAPAPVLHGVPESLATAHIAQFRHMAALAVIDRAAFLPFLFTHWTTIGVAPGLAAIAEPQGGPATPDEIAMALDPARAGVLARQTDPLGDKPYWRDWPAQFDVALWLDFTGQPPPPPAPMQPLAQGRYFRLYRIAR